MDATILSKVQFLVKISVCNLFPQFDINYYSFIQVLHWSERRCDTGAYLSQFIFSLIQIAIKLKDVVKPTLLFYIALFTISLKLWLENLFDL